MLVKVREPAPKLTEGAHDENIVVISSRHHAFQTFVNPFPFRLPIGRNSCQTELMKVMLSAVIWYLRIIFQVTHHTDSQYRLQGHERGNCSIALHGLPASD